jgi:hypothetical protein
VHKKHCPGFFFLFSYKSTRSSPTSNLLAMGKSKKDKKKSKEKSKEKAMSKDKGGKKDKEKKRAKSKVKAKDKKAVDGEGLDWTALSQGQQEDAAKMVEKKRKRSSQAATPPVEHVSEDESQAPPEEDSELELRDDDDEEGEEEEEEDMQEPPPKKAKVIGTVFSGKGTKAVSIAPRPVTSGKMPKKSQFAPGQKPRREGFQEGIMPPATGDEQESSESDDDYSSSSSVVLTKGLKVLDGFWSLVPVRGVGVRDVVLQCVFLVRKCMFVCAKTVSVPL